MDTQYTCYCGLYCENCAVKAKILPASQILYKEMVNAGFDEIIQFIPGGDGFWPFLKHMADKGLCSSCREGGGNPGCAIRICAKEKGVEMCALCDSYPCDHFTAFFDGYPVLENDNEILRKKGIDAWSKLQEQRKSEGFNYSDDKKNYLLSKK